MNEGISQKYYGKKSPKEKSSKYHWFTFIIHKQTFKIAHAKKMAQPL